MIVVIILVLHLIVYGGVREIFIKNNIGTEINSSGDTEIFIASIMAFFWFISIPILMGKQLYYMFTDQKENL